VAATQPFKVVHLVRLAATHHIVAAMPQCYNKIMHVMEEKFVKWLFAVIVIVRNAINNEYKFYQYNVTHTSKHSFDH